MRTPRPPSPERSAQLRRRFADEARSERPDLSHLCLLVAAVADGTLDDTGMDAVQLELDALAGQLPFRPGGPRQWATAVRELLGVQRGFGGSPADYRYLESSLLHEVLRRGRGLPILLSVLWTEVARRAGAPVHGVALPGHFVVGFGPPASQVLADPFNGGRPLTPEDARALTPGHNPPAFTPADPLSVVQRILNNIRAWAAARPECAEVALWAVDLSLLLPAHPASLRYERAQLLVAAGDFTKGAAELDAYADIVTAVDEPTATKIRAQARAARAQLN